MGSISEFHRSKFHKPCNGDRKITKREVPKAKGIVWATAESARGQVVHSRQEVNSVDGFRVSWGEVPSLSHQDSRYREVRSPNRSEVALKVKARECIRVSENRDLGVEETSFSTSRSPKSP
jgi:hypothetical protein